MASLRRALSILALWCTPAMIAGCPDDDAAIEKVVDASIAKNAPSAPTTPPSENLQRIRKLKTIRASDAIKGFERTITNGRGMLKKNPANFMGSEKLVNGLSARVQINGTFTDFDEMLSTAGAAVEQHKDPRSYALRASARAAVHRFDEALQDLELASKQRNLELESSYSSIHLAVGEYDEALELAKKGSREHPDFMTLSFEAMVLGRLGQFEEAEKRFTEAEKSFKSRAPGSLAWHLFQRGSMWQRAGDQDKAREYFSEAVARMPMYAHAVVHYADYATPARAKELLQPLLESSEDPEVDMALARILDKEAKGSGQKHVDAAGTKYTELMKKYPKAFADHAGWFYLDPMVNDPAKAVEAAEINLNLRKVPEAFQLSMAAYDAAKNEEKFCEVAKMAAQFKYPTPSLHDALHRNEKRCGLTDHRHADDPAEAGHEHEHEHDGSKHSHGHEHADGDEAKHEHEHDAKAGHEHEHEHEHDGSKHSHGHAHEGGDESKHDHEHDAAKPHTHEGHDHGKSGSPHPHPH